MSILMGALGGLGDAGQQIGQTMAKASNDQDLAKMQSDLAEQKAEALATFNRNAQAAAGQAITQQADQVRLGRIANLLATSGQRNSQVGTDSTFTPYTGSTDPTSPDVAAIAADPAKLAQYGIIDRTRLQQLGDLADAAEKSGNLDFATNYRTQQTSEIANKRADQLAIYQERKADYNDAMASVRDKQADNQAARTDLLMQRIEAKGNAKDPDLAPLLATINGERANQISLGKELSALVANPPAKASAEYKPYMDEITDKRTELANSRTLIRAITNTLAKNHGISLPGNSDTPDPAPVAAPGTTIGSGGKAKLSTGTLTLQPDGTFK